MFLLLGTVLAGSADQENTYRHFEVFAEVLSRIKSEYVEEPDMKGRHLRCAKWTARVN